jgi:hypothetical protein
VSRPPKAESTTPHRDRLKQELSRATPLREQYPLLAEVRVELQFDDRISPPPSSQAFSYFPAARGFFRYSCPCHSCSGDFDLTRYVEELAGKPGVKRRTRQINMMCMGSRLLDHNESSTCAIGAQVVVSVVPHMETPQ